MVGTPHEAILEGWSTPKLYVVPFWIVYSITPKKKSGQNQKGIILEPLGRVLLKGSLGTI